MSETIVLWPNGAPGAVGKEPADVPTLTVVRPARPNGAAIIVCPGGGYQMLADHEGKPVAEWLAGLGFVGIVLKYRHAPRYRHPSPLQDAQRAIRHVRGHSAEWGIDPQRIGILGFSAGGHLASSAGTHFDAGKPNAAEPLDRLSSRPDFMVLVYPVITFGEFGHMGSCHNLLGERPSAAMIDLFSNEKEVTPQTPPAFLVHTAADASVPCENSMMFAAALHRAGVPFELHILEKGGHGMGIGQPGQEPSWPKWLDICAVWLDRR